MGFSKAQSESAIKDYGTVQSALESILGYSENGKRKTFPTTLFISYIRSYNLSHILFVLL
jgi:hypothetical protein